MYPHPPILEDAEIHVPTLERHVRVNPVGRFILVRVPAGTYLVETESARSVRNTTTIRIVDATTVEVGISLESAFHLDEILVGDPAHPGGRGCTNQGRVLAQWLRADLTP